MKDLIGVDWTEKRIFLHRGEEIACDFEGLMEKARYSFWRVIRETWLYKFCRGEWEDIWQTCSLRLAEIYALGQKRFTFFFLFKVFRQCLTRYYIRYHKHAAPAALDKVIFENNDDTTLADIIPCFDEYFRLYIDYSVFTDEEDEVIDKLVNGLRVSKTVSVYSSVCEKLQKQLDTQESEIRLPEVSVDKRYNLKKRYEQSEEAQRRRKERYEKNKAEVLAKMKARSASLTPEQRAHINERKRLKRLENHEKSLAYMAAYRKKNREKLNEDARRQYAKGKGKFLLANRIEELGDLTTITGQSV